MQTKILFSIRVSHNSHNMEGSEATMKNRKLTLLLVTPLILAGCMLFGGCSTGDTAIVTINLGLNGEPHAAVHESIIDKILSLFSARAMAFSFNRGMVNAITLTVTGTDMEQINVNIPPTSDSFTVEIPAGKQRSFTVRAFGLNPYGGQDVVQLCEGKAAADLNANESVTLTINMVVIFE